MRLYHLAEADGARLAYEMISFNVNESGIARMTPKGQLLIFKVTGLTNAAALILKQEFLAKGGEAAISHDAVLGASHEQTALLLATAAQYKRICADLHVQPFGLAALAKELLAALQILESTPKSIAFNARYHTGELNFSWPLIMGIVNLTPDSFFDGGLFDSAQAAAEYILTLVEAGADIVDIGGASSRPNYTPLNAKEEGERILPVLELIAPHIDLPISVDTDKAEVAARALEAGAAIINDTGGLDEDMARLAAESGAPLVLMHRGGGDTLVESVVDYFRDGLIRGARAGIKREQFILDPGFGFDKNVMENLLILRHLQDIKLLGRPLLVGLSNKRFIGAASQTSLDERGAANIAASAWAMAHGADIIRTHDTKSLHEAALIIKSIKGVAKGV